MFLNGRGITHSMENAKEMLISTGKLALKVHPRARSEGIEGLNAAGELVVKVRVAPEDGKANEAVIALIAQAFSSPNRGWKYRAARYRGIRYCRYADPTATSGAKSQCQARCRPHPYRE